MIEPVTKSKLPEPGCSFCKEMREAAIRMAVAYKNGNIELGNQERDLITKLSKQKAVDFATRLTRG